MNFRVGDLVKCIDSGAKSFYWELGKMFVIERIGDSDFGGYAVGVGAEGGIHLNSVELLGRGEIFKQPKAKRKSKGKRINYEF